MTGILLKLSFTDFTTLFPCFVFVLAAATGRAAQRPPQLAKPLKNIGFSFDGKLFP